MPNNRNAHSPSCRQAKRRMTPLSLLLYHLSFLLSPLSFLLYHLSFIISPLAFIACSTTKSIPDDDQLFTGLTKIDYKNYVDDDHFIATQEEVEAALATAPNGAFFGSSYYRSPLPVGLWVWNAYSQDSSAFARWMTRSFGSTPVLMSQVNPALRASVAQSVLRKNGYFRSSVGYEEVAQKNPKKAKIGYTVSLDTVTVVDSFAYVGFPAPMQHLIDSTCREAVISRGTPFSVANLDAERSRLGLLMRNNGYYFYSPSYASYLADTFDLPYRAQLRLQLASEVPQEALRQWHIGNIDMTLRRSMREQMTDSTHRRHLTVRYAGQRAPLRPRVILRDLKLRSRQLYSYDNYQQSVQKINATGVFSSTDFQFRPRTDSDTLDLSIVCTFDKPYDFYFEANAVGRTSGRMGPEAKVGFTRRNAFRGGEKLDVNLHGAYEWQTSGGGHSMNSYQYGADASIEFPRIILPYIVRDRIRRNKDGTIRRPRRYYATPTTLAKFSTDIVHRPSYYRMHIVTGEWTYRWQPSETSRHELSPLTLKYQYMNSHTQKFDSILLLNPYLMTTMDDHFIPKIRYTYTYTSPSTKSCPWRWETTIEEAGNMTALYDVLIQGNGWNQKQKTLFKNPYSQFLRVETDVTKTWKVRHAQGQSLVAHLNAGVIYSYGNADDAPFSEGFYAGGANSVRAFTVRSIGPGAFMPMGNKQASYLMQNGEVKFVANLEYRRSLFGNLHGAVFLDAGNVWALKKQHIEGEDEDETGLIRAYNQLFANTHLQAKTFLKQLATGTGLGLRYDMEFLIIRVDWGFALHAPYPTGKRGYLNLRHFSDMHSLHLAIGYPF